MKGNLKTSIPLAAATVLGLVAAVVARRVVTTPTVVAAIGQPAHDLRDVVVAARDLDPGTLLTAGDLVVAKVESGVASERAFAAPDLVAGRVARLQILRGTTVAEPLLAPVGSAAGLSGIIRPGYRAVTVDINRTSGVGGFLQPGSRVDLVARLPAEKDQPAATRTILQNLEIIAVGAQLSAATSDAPVTPGAPPAPGTPESAPRPPAGSVMLFVTPDAVELLDLAVSLQSRFVLRGPTDGGVAEVRGVTVEELRRETRPQSAARRPADAGTEARLARFEQRLAEMQEKLGVRPAGSDPFAQPGDPAAPAAPRGRRMQVIRAGAATIVDVPERTAPVASRELPVPPGAMSGSGELLAPVDR